MKQAQQQASRLEARLESAVSTGQAELASKDAELQSALQRAQEAEGHLGDAEGTVRRLQQQVTHEQEQRHKVVREIDARHKEVAAAKVPQRCARLHASFLQHSGRWICRHSMLQARPSDRRGMHFVCRQLTSCSRCIFTGASAHSVSQRRPRPKPNCKPHRTT